MQKNGLLVHRESAPVFLYTSDERAVCPPSSTQGSSLMKIAVSVPSPAPLMKMVSMGKVSEHKIEYVDQLMPKNTVAGLTSVEVSGEQGRSLGQEQAAQEAKSDRKPDEERVDGSFDTKRLQFINEAREWSRKLKIGTSQKLVEPRSVSGLSGLSRANAHRPPEKANSEATLFSQEEQERLLKKHFDAVASSTTALSTTHLPSQDGSPAAGRSRSPHPSPISLPFASSSPQKTPPLNPYLVSQPSSASMLTLFGSTVSSLQSPAAGTSFLCSPSAAQTSPYTAAVMNPFQVRGGSEGTCTRTHTHIEEWNFVAYAVACCA